jgi:hypothetical protein
MATISHNDLAPAEKVHYSLAGAEFDIEGDGTYETDDHQVIANARSHPWLEVEVPLPKVAGGVYGREHLSPKDDAFSAENSVANNADAVNEELERRFGDDLTPTHTAIDAGLDQGKVKFEGKGERKIAETLAADDQQAEQVKEAPAPSRSKAAEKQNVKFDKADGEPTTTDDGVKA